jgi:group I intron endonuclease
MEKEDYLARVIYKITNLITGRMYIGQTLDFDQRTRNHKKFSTKELYIDKSINFHGKENFSFESICDCRNLEQANKMEKFFIKFYNTFEGDGYNLTEGGKGHSFSRAKKLNLSHACQGKVGRYGREAEHIGVEATGKSFVTTVSIKINYRKRKSFPSLIEAAEAYDKMVLYIFGKGAVLNFPEKISFYLSIDLEGFYNFFTLPSPTDPLSQYFGVTRKGESWIVSFYGTKIYKDLFLSRKKELGLWRLKTGNFKMEDEAAKCADKINKYLNLNAPYNFPEDIYTLSDADIELFIKSISEKKTSKYQWVWLSDGKWRAKFKRNGIFFSVPSRFDSEEEAYAQQQKYINDTTLTIKSKKTRTTKR